MESIAAKQLLRNRDYKPWAFCDYLTRPGCDADYLTDDNGKRFLMVERKRAGERISIGQWRLLVALSKLPEFTVYLVQEIGGDLLQVRTVPSLEPQTMTWADFNEVVDRWAGPAVGSP
jgi:hypothetical protein